MIPASAGAAMLITGAYPGITPTEAVFHEIDPRPWMEINQQLNYGAGH